MVKYQVFLLIESSINQPTVIEQATITIIAVIALILNEQSGDDETDPPDCDQNDGLAHGVIHQFLALAFGAIHGVCDLGNPPLFDALKFDQKIRHGGFSG